MSDPATMPVLGPAKGSKAKQRAMPTRKEKQDISIMEVCSLKALLASLCAYSLRRRIIVVLPRNEASKKSTTKTIMAFYDIL